MEKRNFQYCVLPYCIFHPFVWAFAQWVRWRKIKAGNSEEIKHYAWFYDKYSAPVMQVRKGAARWPALEAVYNWRKGDRGIFSLLEGFWMNVRSAQGLRNRKEIVVSLIKAAVLEKIKTDGEARILSLACGSAQSVFEAIQGMEKVSVLAIDVDDTAIEYSKKLAQKYGITNIEWRKGNLVRPGSISNGYDPNVVEIVGLFDYLKDSLIIRLIQSVSELSAPGAVLISAHIHPNPEMYILEAIADWDMTYRPLSEFKQIIHNSGLTEAKYHTEPHGIFSVVEGIL